MAPLNTGSGYYPLGVQRTTFSVRVFGPGQARTRARPGPSHDRVVT
jgi:hypothetical protein